MVELLDIVQRWGPWALVLLLGLWILQLLTDEERAAQWRARLYKSAFRFTGRTDQEKRYIANDIRAQLNTARKKLHAGSVALPKLADIVWVAESAGSALDIKEGEFIVRLDPSAHQEKNIALLASAVVSRTTLQGIRHSVERPLQLAIEFTLTRALLSQLRNRAALDWFLQYEYQPALQTDGVLQKRNEQIVTIDERGLFTVVLLAELDAFSKKIIGMPPRPWMAGEVEDFVEFLYAVANREPGVEVPLEFRRAYISVGLLIVAKTEKLLMGVEPYIAAFQSKLDDRLRAIYVLAFEKEALSIKDYKQYEAQIERLDERLDQFAGSKEFDVEYPCIDHFGRRRCARCVRYVFPEDDASPRAYSAGAAAGRARRHTPGETLPNEAITLKYPAGSERARSGRSKTGPSSARNMPTQPQAGGGGREHNHSS